MKSCPHCKIQVGGRGEYCPLCQSPLVGEGGVPYFPNVEPAMRRASLLYKFVAFFLLGGTVVCAAVDFLLTEEEHLHWSVLVLACVIAVLLLLHTLMKRRHNAPRLLFQILVGASVLTLFGDWFLGWKGYSIDLVIPILCIIALVINFIFAFVNTRVTENALVYLLLNMLLGVVPYVALTLRRGTTPIAWVLCLVVSVITFLGLVIFKWRTLRIELQKRLHM